MNITRLCNVVMDKETSKPELKVVFNELLDAFEELPKEQQAEAATAILKLFVCNHDVIRKQAVEFCVDNVQIFLETQINEVLFTLYKILYTANNSYNHAEKQEDIREEMLRILLKFIISLEKEEDVPKNEKFIPLISKIIISQLADPCPENKIMADKCLFRFARYYKHLLEDTLIGEISEVIIKHFNHQRWTVRQLNLQAFTELHLCDKSKDIREWFSPIMTFLLNDEHPKMLVAFADCCDIFMRKHMDRHLFCDIFCLPLLCNLQDEYCYSKFVAIGEIYVAENAKYDKFLQLQNELESGYKEFNDNVRIYDDFITQFYQNTAPHFAKQLNLGCRVLGKLVLQKQIKAILRDLQSVNSVQRLKINQLLCNLIVLNGNHIQEFQLQIVSNLQYFIATDNQKLLFLLSVFSDNELIIGNLTNQFNGSKGSLKNLQRLFLFLGQFLTGKYQNIQFAGQLTAQMIGKIVDFLHFDNLLFCEDTDTLKCQLLLCYQLVQYISILNVSIEEEFVTKLSVSICSVCQKLEKFQEVTWWKEFVEQYCLQDYLAVLKSFLVKTNNYSVISQFLSLSEQEYRSIGNLEQKISFFSMYVEFTSSEVKKAQLLLNKILNRLLVLSEINEVPHEIRQNALICAKILIGSEGFERPQIPMCLENVVKCCSWVHGARTPLCLIYAFDVLVSLLQEAVSKDVVLDKRLIAKIIGRPLNNLDSDIQEVRERSVAVADLISQICQRQNVIHMEDLAYQLILRLDDSKSKITIQALDVSQKILNYQNTKLHELGYHDYEAQNDSFNAKFKEDHGVEPCMIICQKQNITELLLTHLNDNIVSIRQKCYDFLKSLKGSELEIEIKSKLKGRIFSYYKGEDIFLEFGLLSE